VALLVKAPGLVIERLQNLGATPDAVARRCVLGKDTYCCFPPWSQAVYLLWWPSLTKDMQTEQLLCWSGMHSTTSGSNEVVVADPTWVQLCYKIKPFLPLMPTGHEQANELIRSTQVPPF